MPSVKIQNNILKKEYQIQLKKALNKINGTKPSQLIMSNGNIRTESKS
jgi:hypothetical protein